MSYVLLIYELHLVAIEEQDPQHLTAQKRLYLPVPHAVLPKELQSLLGLFFRFEPALQQGHKLYLTWS